MEIQVRLVFRMLLISTAIGVLLVYSSTNLYGSAIFLTVFGLCCAFVGFDTRMHRIDRSTITERWMFYGWCFARGPAFAFGYLVFMLTIGTGQLIGAGIEGSAEAHRQAYGLIYAELPHSGEWWRLLTAPLVHFSTEHWLSNTIIGTGLLCIYGPVLGWRGVCAMLISAPAAYAILLPLAWNAPMDSEGVIGISGGISGLVGCFLAANLRQPGSFPRQYAVVTGFVAAIMLFVVPVFLSLTSFVTHFAGFLVGLLFGLLVDPFTPQFHRRDVG